VESTCTYDVTLIHLVSYENNNKLNGAECIAVKKYSWFLPTNASGYVAVGIFGTNIERFPVEQEQINVYSGHGP
jgi:hypothetical protein